MGMIDRELDKLGRALRSARKGHYNEIYAAQQALAWALDPYGFKSPADMLTGIPADATDCPACPDQPRSVDTCSQSARSPRPR